MWGCVEFLPLRSGPFWVFAVWAVGVAWLLALRHAGSVSVGAGRRVARLFIGQALLVLGGALGGAALRQHDVNPSDLYLTVLIALQLSFPAGFLWVWVAAKRSRQLLREPVHAQLAGGCSFPAIIFVAIGLGLAAGLAIFVDFVARHLLEGPGSAHLEHLYWGLALALAALWRVERGLAQPASRGLWRSLGLATGALWSLGVLGLLKSTSNNGVAASDQCLVEHLVSDLVNGHAAHASLRELKARPAPRFTSFSLERQRIVAQALQADWQVAKDKRWTSTSVVMFGSPPFFDDPAASLLEIQMQRGSFVEALSWLNDDRVAEETRVRLVGLFAQHPPVCPECDPLDTLTTVLELCETPRSTTAGCEQVSLLLDSLTRPPWSVTPRFAFAALPALLRYLPETVAQRLLDHSRPPVAGAARLRLALLLGENPTNAAIFDDTERECKLMVELKSEHCGASSGPLAPSACDSDVHERKRLVDATAKEIQVCVNSRPPAIAPELRSLLRQR